MIEFSRSANYPACKVLYGLQFTYTMKRLLSGDLRDLSKCPLNRRCPLKLTRECSLSINIQRLLCTVIKLHVIKAEAIQSSSSFPFTTNFNLFVNAKTLTNFSPYFKDVIQYYYCQFSPVSA